MLKIQVINRSTNQKKSYQFTQHAILIGRQNNSDIVLESNSISRRHAKITLNKHLIEIEDLGSGNGTLVNQKKIPPKEKIPITAEDKIRIEEYDFELEMEHSVTHKIPVYNRDPDITDPDILEIKMIKKVLGALDHEKLPSITITSEPFKNTKAVFDEDMGQLIIGRDTSCQLSLDSNVVSRQHAALTLKWGGFVIKDLESKNGTFVNGERIEEKSIKDGDEIVFGTIKSIFKNPQEFDFDTISRSIQDQKQHKQDVHDLEASALKQEEKVQAISDDEPKKKKQQDTDSNQDKKEKTKDATPPELSKDAAQKTPLKKKNPKTVLHEKSKNILRQLSTLELILMGFGTLTFILVLYFLIRLFS